MDTRVANMLMREEAGVAPRLLYSIKQNMASMTKTLTVGKCTSARF